MSCVSTLSGLQLGCESNMGGLKCVYIANYDDVVSVTNTGVNEITDITMAATAKFKKYEFRKQTGSLTSTITKDDAIGTIYYTNEVNLQFSKMETVKRLELSALSLGQLAVIVEDQNGKFWYLGYDNYVTGLNTTAASGTNYGELNGYTITLNDMSVDLPYEVQSSVITTVTE